MNYKIEKGDRVFIKGKSGVGKTTLLKLIQGEYTFDSGTILLGNESINNWKRDALYENINYGSINSKVFRGKIKDNISKNLDTDKLNNILNITKLSLNLEYIVEEDASNISLGEKARLLLTRILYNESSILIIDELLSNIGEIEEKEILLKVFEYFKDKIIIYTSHRNLDNLFNKVLTLGKGNIYEIN